MKSRTMVASGAMTRSTDECEMSLSCQSATSSSAGDGVAAEERASPLRFSRQDRVSLVRHRRGALLALGERFLGLARPRCAASGEPRRRTSRSRRRRAPARGRTRRADRAATICVATVSARRPSSAQRRALHRGRRVGEGADRAGDLADGDRARARARGAAARPISSYQLASLRPKVDRLGVDAVRAADHRRVLVLERALPQRRVSRRAPSSRSRRSARAVARQRACRARPRRSCPRCSQRARPPARSSTWVRNAITSCRVSPRSRRCAPDSACRRVARTDAAVPFGDRANRLHRVHRRRARPRARNA